MTPHITTIAKIFGFIFAKVLDYTKIREYNYYNNGIGGCYMRATKEKKRYLGLYLDSSDYKALAEVCKAESRNKSGQVRKLIRDAYEKMRSEAA